MAPSQRTWCHLHFQEQTFSNSEVTHGPNHLESQRQRAAQGLWETEEHLLPAFVLSLLGLLFHPFSDWRKGLATPNCCSGFLLVLGGVWEETILDRRLSFFKNLMTYPSQEPGEVFSCPNLEERYCVSSYGTVLLCCPVVTG